MHQVTQHRSHITGVEARTIASVRSFPRHFHDQFGVGMMLAGAHRSWSGIGAVEATAGDCIMTNPGEMHDGAPVRGAPREWRMLYFDVGLVRDVAAREDIRCVELTRPAVDDSLLALHFQRLFARTVEPVPDRLAIDERLLVLVVCALRRHGLDTQRARLSPSIRAAFDAIDADPAAQLTLADLAAASGISRFQLVRGFVREVGATPHAYVVQRRVQLARRFLAGGDAIAEAAIKAGFADQSHLTRAFVRQFGVTPGRYRAAVH